MNIDRRLRSLVFRGFLLAAVAGLVWLLATQNVSTELTTEDRDYAERILAAAGYPKSGREWSDLKDFESQIRAIVAVQDAVLTVAPVNEGLPLGQFREPKDLYAAKRGLCFDRSRSMEKLLTHLGLKVRHVAIYATTERSALAAILTPENSSHAVSEVLTAKGWLLLDSNARWIGLTADRRAIGAAELQQIGDRREGWASESKASINAIFVGDYIFLYGLYSRHGRFYPPFTPVPDVNFRQLLDNI